MEFNAERSGEYESFLARHFTRTEPRMRARDYLQGLLSDMPRKSGQQLAHQANHRAPDGVRWLLAGAVWDADGLRDDIREHLSRSFQDEAAALVVDDVGFVKRGDKSAGVAVQYNSTTGRTENCQVGMFAALATRRGRALIDRELYLPPHWVDVDDRRRAAGVPAGTAYRSRTALACEVLGRTIRAGVRFRWVVAGRSYGDDPGFREYCADHRLAFVVEVSPDHPVASGGGDAIVPRAVLRTLPGQAFERWGLGWSGHGSGWNWAAVGMSGSNHRLRPALLVGRPGVATQEPRFFLGLTPINTTLGELVHAASLRSAVAEGAADARDYAGFDQYEVRKYVAWYRHVTLAMLACATLAVRRTRIDERAVSTLSATTARPTM